MTNEEQNDLAKKESKCLWRCRTFKLAVLGVVILLAIVIVQKARFRARQIGCALQLKCLQSAFPVYMNDFEGKLPTANAWNDLMIEYEGTEMIPSVFHCPGSRSSGKTSDYAINVNWYGNEAIASGETIFLFECKLGWNQVGGPDIFNSKNHKNKGAYNTMAIPEGQFVESEKVQSLKWKP